jgi:DHA2 family metal-tetracycline-proton antiporter-like MFS transporter
MIRGMQMTTTTAHQPAGNTLFITCFAALVATAFCFVLRAFVIDDWGHEFNLSATQKGELLGVGLWPFSISIVLLSLLIDRVGFRAVLWFAVFCHVIGTMVMLTATGYWPLYVGTFILALGNGAVEAAVNPLIATAYRHDKTKWLNMLHAGWPGGLVLGGLLAIAQGGGVDWRWKIGLVIVPVIVYSVMLLRQRFPVSERVAAGVSYRDMLAEAGYISALIVASLIVIEIGRVFLWPTMLQVVLIAALTAVYAFYTRSPGRPLFIVMLLIMVPLATTELGTDSWITSLLEPEMVRIGLQPGWVLVYTSALMLVLRLFAGPLVHRFSPLGLLALCSAIAAVGLYSLAVATGAAVLLAATLYGVGKSFFWPTSIGFVAEQFPKGGAVTMNVIAGVGMLAVGIVGSVLLGSIQDRTIGAALAAHDAQHGAQLHATFFTNEKTGVFGRYLALDDAKVAGSDAETRAVIGAVVTDSKKTALKSVAVLPLIMLVSYLFLMLYFRRLGGYRAVALSASPQGS